MNATIGRIVIYKLAETDANLINQRRNAPREDDFAPGGQQHVGNPVHAGDEYPMVITRVWGPTAVNGQVLLDGNDVLWATSIAEGTDVRQYRWPAREAEPVIG